MRKTRKGGLRTYNRSASTSNNIDTFLSLETIKKQRNMLGNNTPQRERVAKELEKEEERTLAAIDSLQMSLEMHEALNENSDESNDLRDQIELLTKEYNQDYHPVIKENHVAVPNRRERRFKSLPRELTNSSGMILKCVGDICQIISSLGI
jgi:hypothetical protein